MKLLLLVDSRHIKPKHNPTYYIGKFGYFKIKNKPLSNVKHELYVGKYILRLKANNKSGFWRLK